MGNEGERFDLAVVGGGINGAGIACDAAGRGLRVLLVEARDLAAATSSASSKLIHGGLRYLEHWEFRLVREALAEREVMLRKAPHIVHPLRIVLPMMAGMRPAWMLRLGLFLYDHLSRRVSLPGSRGLDFSRDPAGHPLVTRLRRGFAYWDCAVDDARLVVLNARAAADRGADIRTRTALARARPDGAGGWRLGLRDAGGGEREVRAQVLVNAAGPWVEDVLGRIEMPPGKGRAAASGAHARLRLVKGSHIVVPRIPGAGDGYILQNPDGRVVFILPFAQAFSLIGTTDVPFEGDPAEARIDEGEIDYLLEAANRALARPLARADIVWSFSGVRALFDDSAANASAVTRDYRLVRDWVGDGAGAGGALLLSLYGGKLTTYRRLAEKVLDELAPHLPPMGPAWTETATLPGGDLPEGGLPRLVEELKGASPNIDEAVLEALAGRHGTLARRVLDGARSMADLGAHVGGTLYEREVAWLAAHEWAQTPEDVLWRRTKEGLFIAAEARAEAERLLAEMLS